MTRGTAEVKSGLQGQAWEHAIGTVSAVYQGMGLSKKIINYSHNNFIVYLALIRITLLRKGISLLW